MSLARNHSVVADAMLSWSRSSFLWIVLTGLLAACAGGDLVLPREEGPTIRVVDGNGQSGQVGELLSAPVVVEVNDAGGLPVAGATVEFELTSAGAGAEVLPSTGTTGANGRAETRVLLGSKVGVQTGEARVVVDGTTSPKASFTAVATSDNPDNRPPRADYNWHCENLSCEFTDASTDDDGTVIGWNWQFGDGGRSDDSEPAHVYGAPGRYTVTLTVTDNDGATDESTAHVDVTMSSPPPESNKPPDADFEVHCSGLTCTFTDKSKDDDGSIVGWLWIFGDGPVTSNQKNPVHTYASPGKYDVLLTVTDNRGAADTKTRKAEPKD